MLGKFRVWHVRMANRTFCFCEAWPTNVRPLIFGTNSLRLVIEHAISSFNIFVVFRHQGESLPIGLGTNNLKLLFGLICF